MHWIIRYAMSFGAMALLLLAAEVTRRRLGITAVFTRKVIHTAMGLLILLSPVIFQAKYPVLLVAVMLFLVDLFVVRFSQRFEREYRTYGILYYPAVLFLLILICWDNHIHVLMGAVCVMSFGDGFSALVGTAVGKHEFSVTGDRKTLEGSVAMYLASAVSLSITLGLFTGNVTLSVAAALLVPIVAAVVEAASSKGLDNVTVPLVSAALIYYLFSRADSSALWLAVSIPVAAVFSLIAFALGALTGAGAVAAFVIGTLVFAIGKLNAAMALVTFFATSSLLSRIGRARKARARGLSDKGSRRDLVQAFANGGVALSLLLASMFNPCWWAYMFFLAALASATADTWATEIGTLSRSQPVSLRDFSRVPCGTSGAVSLPGTAAAVAGSCAIGIFAGFYRTEVGFNGFAFAAVALSGFLGSLVDSLLGATVQAQYARSGGGPFTEVRAEGSRLARGKSWIGNDLVNFMSTAFAAVVCFLLFLVLGPSFCQ
jgi:uncharacterized protein (TIGR00297 family)